MDIIFFAIVALYIFFKLKNQLGKVDDGQRRDAIKKFLKEQADLTSAEAQKNTQDNELDAKILKPEAPSEESKVNQQSQEIINSLSAKLRVSLEEVLKKSKVSAVDFLNGANMAFDMIITAFSEGNKSDLKSLLSSDLYKKFSTAIDDREDKGNSLKTNVIAIDESIIKDAKIEGNYALILVNFKTKQISYVLDSDGEVVEGSKEDINQVSDIWTFKRNIRSKNPNWIITSTKS